MKKKYFISLMFGKTKPQIQNHSDLFLKIVIFIIIHFYNSNICQKQINKLIIWTQCNLIQLNT